MHLYQGFIEGPQRVEQRNRGVAVGAGVQDEPGETAGDFLNPGDEFAFAVALSTLDLNSESGRLVAAHRLDIGERRPAIDVRLPPPEQVQVGTVEDQDLGAIGFRWGWGAFLARLRALGNCTTERGRGERNRRGMLVPCPWAANRRQVRGGGSRCLRARAGRIECIDEEVAHAMQISSLRRTFGRGRGGRDRDHATPQTRRVAGADRAEHASGADAPSAPSGWSAAATDEGGVLRSTLLLSRRHVPSATIGAPEMAGMDRQPTGVSRSRGWKRAL